MGQGVSIDKATDQHYDVQHWRCRTIHRRIKVMQHISPSPRHMMTCPGQLLRLI